MRPKLKIHLCAAAAFFVCGNGAAFAELSFPEIPPERSSFVRPADGEETDVSPPGFCWHRLQEDGKSKHLSGKVHYRLILSKDGKEVFRSPLLADPAYVPDRVLEPGVYSWTVEGLDANGKVADTRPSRSFTILPDAFAQPWIPAAELLSRVPKEHPRCLFPKAMLPEVRRTLETTRKEPFQSLSGGVRGNLKLTPPPEPDYDKLPTRSQQRLGYLDSFRMLRNHHNGAMLDLALMYLLGGDKKCGEAAKAQLMNVTGWDVNGISSILSKYGDEPGLGLAYSAALTYDWIYDLLTPPERRKVEDMLVARGDEMLRRLAEKSDYLSFSSESHNGRLPGYLMEYAVAMAEHPRAAVWLDYAMKAAMTVFPHWAGHEGGWAEGINYGLAYNSIYMRPFVVLERATGFDLWQRPFYRKVRYFFLHNISPVGEISPWGDTEDGSITGKASGVRTLLQFHALRYRDPVVRWWVELLRDDKGNTPRPGGVLGLILPDDLEPEKPASLPNDRAFRGVGWATLHSRIMEPEKDLMVMFKCSPYGGMSHSHADQNSFAIMKGGRALAIPAGERWPTHGSPFHTQYVQQSMAHNTILVNGQGQINRSSQAGGEIADFQSTEHMGYVCGDATNCCGDALRKFKRHVLLVRPSLVIVVDDLEAPENAEFQWLLHARDRMILDPDTQSVTTERKGEKMEARLFTPGAFRFSQTDAWPVDPYEGYPTAKATPPEKQWHFTATTEKSAARRRIAAVMRISEGGALPDVTVKEEDGILHITGQFDGGAAEIQVGLGGEEPLLNAGFTKRGKAPESIVKP